MDQISPNFEFQAAREKIESITDGLGLPIDEGIKDVVASINMYGIETTSSCAGHLDRGYPYPWIDFGHEGVAAIEESDEPYQEELRQKAIKLQTMIQSLEMPDTEISATSYMGSDRLRFVIDVDANSYHWRSIPNLPDNTKVINHNRDQLIILETLLTEFYSNRNNSYDAILALNVSSSDGSSRLESIGGGVETILFSEEKLKRHREYLDEMIAFGSFLRGRPVSHP